MKSRTWITVAVLVLAVSAAHARFADTEPTVGSSAAAPLSAWQQVKVTVSQWLGWSDTPEVPTAPVKVAVSRPASKPVVPAPHPGKTEALPRVVEKANVPEGKKPVSVSEANQKMRAQHLFVKAEPSSTVQDVQAVRDQVKAAPILKVVKPATAGQSKLAKTKSGVPTVNWAALKKGVKKVPRVDIGTESLISREDLTVPNLHWNLGQVAEFKKLPEPKAVTDAEIRTLTSQGIEKAQSARTLQANMRTVGQPVTQEVVDKIQYSIQDVPHYKFLSYKPFAEEELKMLAALILFERGNHCHMIMGLFNRLANADKTRIEATFHLGACAAQLKMHQSAFDNLAKVIASEDKEFAPQAVGILAKDLPLIYEKDFYLLMKRLKAPKTLLTDANRDDVAYRMAKGAYRAGDYKTSLNYVTQVENRSTYFDDARFLAAMNSFALGDKAASLSKLEELWKSLEARKVSDSNIRALTSVNLARMYFAQKKYEKSLEAYMQVPKDHPLWVQALIEQGWTQLALDDFSGAIGNMYSLHSPYFKAVYQPESFVVRTIGYLNICQYGDAYKTLTWLEKDYRDWSTKTNQYISRSGNPDDIYATVKNYIRGKSVDDVEGVPYQVWREIAHKKDFLNLQVALNDKLDEGKRYEGVNEKIKQEKAAIRLRAEQAKKQFDRWRSQLAKATAEKGSGKGLDSLRTELNRQRDLTIGYRFQLTILEQSREGYLEFQKSSQTKLDSETTGLGHKAGETLLAHAKRMSAEMSRVLDNNEFLRYEVFAGSGENIRYQVAGGRVNGTNNRVPASIKPTKMMNWSFDGEYWEDEIGSYRSALQNSCPVSMQAQKGERVPTSEQARHVDSEEDDGN